VPVQLTDPSYRQQRDHLKDGLRRRHAGLIRDQSSLAPSDPELPLYSNQQTLLTDFVEKVSGCNA
jgi:hypothetical protein